MLDGWELYDLKKDPNELNSLYGKKDTKDYFELKDELTRLRKLYQVPEDTRPLVRAPREPRKRKRVKASSTLDDRLPRPEKNLSRLLFHQHHGCLRIDLLGCNSLIFLGDDPCLPPRKKFLLEKS